jgi:hypothetical protein
MSNDNQLTKSQIMALVQRNADSGALHECFTYYPDDGPVTVFDVTAMRTWAKANPSLAPVEHVRISDVIGKLLTDRVIDVNRVRDLPKESWEHDPAMVLVYGAGTATMHHLLIDGTHRIVRRFGERRHDFATYMIDVKHAIYPNYNEYVDGHKIGLDWGDKIIDGKIIKRGT